MVEVGECICPLCGGELRYFDKALSRREIRNDTIQGLQLAKALR